MTAESAENIASLKESEGRLRAILDAAVDAIITIDERGFVQSFNRSAERIFGYAADEVIGQNISMLMPAPYHDEHDGYLQNYLRTGQAKIIGIGREVEAQRKDGTILPAYIAISEVRLQDRRLFTGIVRDISDQKRAEDRALQAERLAAIGQTVTGLAHESRNALQRSQASIEMLEMDLEGNQEALDQLQKIKRAQHDLQQLCDEVRNYAAPIHLDYSECDLRKVWREAWEHLADETVDRDARLQDDALATAIRCRVDRFRMLQVFRNLLENSLTACVDPVRIEIDCEALNEERSDEDPIVRITYRDNGSGLTVEEQRRVFEPFFTTKTKGTGLGMAIAERIVEAHGGSISVSDDTKGGAAFFITLPQVLKTGASVVT
ncbi:MAG: PAS domain S-box protein [Pirellulales bacterium]|nr:PAS domain S-box protein [Pirellulales bacterium]